MSNKNNMGSDKFNFDEFDKSRIFNVPEDYFENLPGKIQNKITAKKALSLHTIFHLNKRMWYAYACGILLLFGIGIYIGQNQNKGELVYSDNSLAGISNEEIIEYLVTNHSSDYDVIKIAETKTKLESPSKLEKVQVDEEVIFENIDYNDVEDLTKQL